MGPKWPAIGHEMSKTWVWVDFARHVHTLGKRSTCTLSACYRNSILPVLPDQLTRINKHTADRVTQFNVSLYFHFNFGGKSATVICCGNEYG